MYELMTRKSLYSQQRASPRAPRVTSSHSVQLGRQDKIFHRMRLGLMLGMAIATSFGPTRN